jgi:MprA protease rhombosortase-interaction domain-containing protein
MKAIVRAAVPLAILLSSGNAHAGTWSVTPNPARIGTAAGSVSEPISIIYTGDGGTQYAQIDYDFAELAFSAQPTDLNSGSCRIVSRDGGNLVLLVLTASNPTNPTAPTTACNVTFTSLSANADSSGAVPEYAFATRNALCFDNVGIPVTCVAGGPIRLDVSQLSQGVPLAVPTIGRTGEVLLTAIIAVAGLLGFARRRRASPEGGEGA